MPVYLNTILFAAQGENNTINYKAAHNNMGSHSQAARGEKKEKKKVRLVSSS